MYCACTSVHLERKDGNFGWNVGFMIVMTKTINELFVKPIILRNGLLLQTSWHSIGDGNSNSRSTNNNAHCTVYMQSMKVPCWWAPSYSYKYFVYLIILHKFMFRFAMVEVIHCSNKSSCEQAMLTMRQLSSSGLFFQCFNAINHLTFDGDKEWGRAHNMCSFARASRTLILNIHIVVINLYAIRTIRFALNLILNFQGTIFSTILKYEHWPCGLSKLNEHILF